MFVLCLIFSKIRAYFRIEYVIFPKSLKGRWMLKKRINYRKILSAVLCAVLGGLTVHSRILSVCAPFAALLPALLPVPLGAAALIGTAVGSVFKFDVSMIAVCAASGAAFISKLRGERSRQAVAASSAAVGAVYLMASAALTVFSGGGIAEFAGEAVMALGLSLSSVLAFSSYTDLSAMRGLSDARILIFSGMTVCALFPIHIGPVSVGGILAGWLVIFAAVTYGSFAAAAVSLVCALAAGLFSPALFCDYVLMGLPTVLCGYLLFGRPIAASAVSTAIFLSTVAIFGVGDFLAVFLEFAIAAAVYVPTSGRAARIVSELRSEGFRSEKLKPPLTLISAVENLSERIAGHARNESSGERLLSDIIKTRICIACPRSKICFGDSETTLPELDALKTAPCLSDVCRALPECDRLSEVAKASALIFHRREYARLKSEERANSARLCTGLLSALCDAVGDSAALCSRTLVKDLPASKRLLGSMRRLGLRPYSCAVMRGGKIEMSLSSRSRLNELKIAAAAGEVTGREYSRPEIIDCKDIMILRLEPKSEYSVETGFCQKPAESSSGDVADTFESCGYSYCILSDGMGIGEDARSAALELTKSVRELICAGFSVDTAVKLGSAALACIMPEECFATLDLLKVNKKTGAAELYKAGGCGSYLILDGRESLLASGGYPVGILDSCDIRVHRFFVRESAALVMLTDGALGVGPKGCSETVSGNFSQSCCDIAAKLLAASEAENSPKKDDASVSVVKIERKLA